MTVKRMNLYVCNLCAVDTSCAIVPPGWIELSIEDSNLDRSWKEMHICPSCMKAINQKQNPAK
jgi:hypothetical protein